MRIAALALLAVVMSGCQRPVSSSANDGPNEARPVPGQRQAGDRVAPITSTDLCATRLHDLSGPLLLHLSLKGDLPRDPQALGKLPGFADMPDLRCPISGKSYIYNPQGLVIPGKPGGIVLYDPDPTHDGLRWGVFIAPGEGNQPMTSRVIAIPAEALKE